MLIKYNHLTMSKINDGHFFGFMAVYTSITIINKLLSLPMRDLEIEFIICEILSTLCE